jgi:hypothetical protein
VTIRFHLPNSHQTCKILPDLIVIGSCEYIPTSTYLCLGNAEI